jgi:predicted O-methyltransferase YrrM
MLKLILKKLDIALRKFFEMRSRIFLRKIPALWKNLQVYLERTHSTGCGYIDYAQLYHAIRKKKPTEVLECGTGVSTLVIAHALMQNEMENGIKGIVTSMEEHKEWFVMSQSLLPSEYAPYVEVRLSATKDDYFSVFRGVRYSEIPEKEYDFVFVDGPKYVSSTDNAATFDFDSCFKECN